MATKTDWRAKPASERQINWILRLGEMTGVDAHGMVNGEMTMGQASELIEELKAMPRKQQPQPEIECGLYEVGDDVFTVTTSKAGRLYATKMYVADGKYGWEYDRGYLATIASDKRLMRLRPTTAARWGQGTSRCICCGRKLKDDRSMAMGYGKVCADAHGWEWGTETLHAIEAA